MDDLYCGSLHGILSSASGPSMSRLPIIVALALLTLACNTFRDDDELQRADTGLDVQPGDTTDISDVFVATTIYDIQQGNIGMGTMVEVSGVVVTGLSSNGFWAQDPRSGPYSGIWCFVGQNWRENLPNVLIGSVVTVSGVVEEFFELTQINAVDVGSVQPTGTAAVPEATLAPLEELRVSSPEAEKWEGVLVSTGEVSVRSPYDEGTNTFHVGVPGVEVEVRVGHTMYRFPPTLDDQLTAGDTFTTVRGPLNFVFGEYQIEPRNAADLVGYTDN